MTDFLTSLAARALGVAKTVRPRPVSRFETDQVGEAPEGELQTPAQSVSGALGDTQVEARAAERGHKAAASSFSAGIEGAGNAREEDDVQRPESPTEKSQPEPAVEFVALDVPPAIEFRGTRETPHAVRVEQTAPEQEEKVYESESLGAAVRPASAPRTETPAVRGPAVRAKTTVRYERAAATSGDLPTASAADTVRVTIGRVDVKAVFTQPGTRTSAEQRPAGPVLSLDDYLKKRGGGRR